MNIAVLALQGAFIEHEQMLNLLGASCFEIRQKKDLEKPFDGLIIPGGESTVQGKLLKDLDLFEPLKKKIESGLPVFGTCAGLLLLADKIENDNRKYFATMKISAKRNAYGRQLGSFYCESDFAGLGKIPMTFIRAPYIETADPAVSVLAKVDGKIVAARQENQLVTSFHPELNDNLSVHRLFLDMVRQASCKNDKPENT